MSDMITGVSVFKQEDGSFFFVLPTVVDHNRATGKEYFPNRVGILKLSDPSTALFFNSLVNSLNAVRLTELREVLEAALLAGVGGNYSKTLTDKFEGETLILLLDDPIHAVLDLGNPTYYRDNFDIRGVVSLHEGLQGGVRLLHGVSRGYFIKTMNDLLTQAFALGVELREVEPA